MRRPFALLFLGIGTVAGFASGFHDLRCARQHRDAFERHVAQVCVDAARAGSADSARPQ